MGGVQPMGINFQIDNLYVEEPGGSPAPSNIIAASAPFKIKLDFSGSGGGWVGLENNGVQYNVDFYCEGMGANAPEVDFGQQQGNLVAGQGNYTATLPVNQNPLTPGVYRFACVITFTGWVGLVGFEDSLMVQVY